MVNAREEIAGGKGSSDEAESEREEEEILVVMLSRKNDSDRAESSVATIQFDLHRTFPKEMFDLELQQTCRRVLEAWTFYRPDTGYVQGMSFLAATLVITLKNPYQSFACLCNMLNSPSLLGLYKLDPVRVARRYEIFGLVLQQQAPTVHQNFEELGMSSGLFLLEWFLTIFSKALRFDIACGVWDLFLLHGESALYSTAVAMLQLLETHLVGKSFEDARMALGRTHHYLTDQSALLLQISRVQTTLSDRARKDIQHLETLEYSPLHVPVC
eukprot:GHVO01046484.1.p1 GENE.GHVO01046484.1~~GHVO01046484.1.p1  ORF type:complete len:271 (+),score=33.88 GHVO01046484.1:788-1600(+)